jgi:hypothetical protein
MLLVLSALLALLFILSGTAAVVQYNKLRESRRRQARSLCLALAASESYRQSVRRPESAGVAQRQQRLVPGIALMNIGSEIYPRSVGQLRISF